MLYRLSIGAAQRPARKGIVLLVVISLLALFAAVGLSFVYYAEAEAAASRVTAQGTSLDQINLDPEVMLNFFLSQFIFDTNNNYSALRGPSLARTMYDYDPRFPTAIPYNGGGLLRYNVTPPAWGGLSKNNIVLSNFTDFSSTDGFARAPGYYQTSLDATWPTFTGGANVPWTYPDMQSLFLASINANGEVLAPSYFRPWVWDDATEASNIENSPKPYAKYMTLRPHKSYHANFENPNEAGGPDVKNFDGGKGLKKPNGGGYFINDSYWIDAGWPVMTAKDGRKFKVLFAPLIIDLDNKVNINVHGNIKGTDANSNPISLSHHGIGWWEVNPQKVLKFDPTGKEYGYLFTGKPATFTGPGIGRYGANGMPDNGPTATYTYGVQPYASFDFDATTTSANLTLPNGVSVFPTYQGTGWGNRGAVEVTPYHPSAYNPYGVVGDDLVPLPVSNMESMLRGQGATGSLALATDLFRILPNNMQSSRARLLTTVRSMDLDRPGFIPYFNQDPNKPPTGNTAYLNFDPLTKLYATVDLTGGGGNPTPKFPLPPLGGPTPFEYEFDVYPPLGTPQPTPGPYWRSALAYAKRILLNRPLTSYPAPDNTGLITDLATYNKALSDRTTMASDIYKWLVKLTGAKDASDPQVGPGMAQNSNDYKAARWLAQVAVNIVDYIDEDDYMTVWQWNPNQATDVVVGTELPKLVVNEVYAQLDNDVGENGNMMATKYYINLWAELHNPMPTTAVALRNTSQQEYQFIITEAQNIDKETGKLINAALGQTLSNTGAAKTAVGPAVGSAGSPYSCMNTEQLGFYVIGPSPPGGYLPNRDPNITATINQAEFSWQVPAAATSKPADYTNKKYAIVMQRLANPKVQANPATNPWVTVDYYDDIRLNNNTEFDEAAAVANLNMPTAFSSQGRAQPYTAHKLRWADQNPDTPPPNQPKNTFFRHNAREDNYLSFNTMKYPTFVPGNPGTDTVDRPFDWLTHLDRWLVNPGELLQVSCFPPHLLTQKFNENGLKFNHRKPWEDPQSFLYRFFEVIQTPDYAPIPGSVYGGKFTGKMAINPMFDGELLDALCDSTTTQVYNGNATDTTTVFGKMAKSRSPWPAANPEVRPGPSDELDTTDVATAWQGYYPNVPFKPYSVGVYDPATNPSQQYPKGLGLGSTLFRTDSTNKLIFGTGQAHPYQNFELLGKIMNNVTTRSNVFAVWLTVGYFEVTDDTVRPVKLGKEIGKDENRKIRRRMFAIVDRTHLFFPEQAGTLALPVAANAGAQQFFVTPNVLTNSAVPGTLNLTLNIRKGLQLIVDKGLPTQEIISVTSVSSEMPPVASAVFTQNHAAGAPLNVIVPTNATSVTGMSTTTYFGNPGPQPAFDYRSNAWIVPYASIIQ
jgi:hypothetical protein